MSDRLILTPYFLGAPVPGFQALVGPGWSLNAPFPGDDEERRRAAHAGLADQVADALETGDRPVSVAGDCCAAIPVLAGARRAGLEPSLLWLDAHGDLNTPETSPSGFVGGMPLAMLVGAGDLAMLEELDLEPIAPDRVSLLGGRDLDPGESDILEATPIRHLPDLRKLTPTTIPDGPLWVHFDVDVVDPGEVPAVAYPAPGGPSARAVAEAFDLLAAGGRVAIVSMSCWDPERDGAERSRRRCMALLGRLLADPHA